MKPFDFYQQLKKTWRKEVKKGGWFQVTKEEGHTFVYELSNGETREEKRFIEEASQALTKIHPAMKTCAVVKIIENGHTIEYQLFFQLMNLAYELEVSVNFRDFEFPPDTISVSFFSTKKKGRIITAFEKTICLHITQAFQEWIEQLPEYRLSFVTGTYTFDTTYVHNSLGGENK